MTRKILITGASVAGNTAALLLSQQGNEVHVVEKADEFRLGGQNVDVRGAGREVLRKMGLDDAAKKLSTGEYGTDFVDENDKVIARFDMDENTDRGLTAELEIRRGDISRLLYEPAAERAAYRFGDTIKEVENGAKGVRVTFASGEEETFDLLIVAEGVGSSTRELVFPGENEPRWMDMTVGYFSIPQEEHDSAFARQYNTIGGRGAIVKPGRDNQLGAYMGIQKHSEGEHEWDLERQKHFMRDQFKDDGWEIPRLLEQMEKTEDFYFDVLRQVKMPRWSEGRIVLTGDAAWCPTPMSGIGTTLAIVGSYVLAGELTRHDNLAEALVSYEKQLRPFIKEGQGLPKIVPRLMWPHTRFGITMLRGALRVAGTDLGQKVVVENFARDSNSFSLPDYDLAAV